MGLISNLTKRKGSDLVLSSLILLYVLQNGVEVGSSKNKKEETLLLTASVLEDMELDSEDIENIINLSTKSIQQLSEDIFIKLRNFINSILENANETMVEIKSISDVFVVMEGMGFPAFMWEVQDYLLRDLKLLEYLRNLYLIKA